MGEFISKYGNPWAADQWNVTLQGQFLRAYGERRARQFAEAAGTTLGGPQPTGEARVVQRTIIINKRVAGSGGGGGGLIGAGSSGEGPPEG